MRMIAAVTVSLLMFLACGGRVAAAQRALGPRPERVTEDWLIANIEQKAVVHAGATENEIVLSNGLVSRTFRLSPDAATVALDNLMTGEAVLRGVKPEAQLSINGVDCTVGGLVGQPNYAYLLPHWLDQLRAAPAAFRFDRYEVGQTKARFGWKRVRHAENRPWPPPGAALTLHFKPTEALLAKAPFLADVTVAIHYEMYDGIPLMCKWMTVHNAGSQALRIDSFTSELLAVVEHESAVDHRERWELPNLHVETDMAFTGMDTTTANHTVHWVPDPQYQTQVNYLRQTPAMLEVKPPLGPDAAVAPGETFETFRTFELIHDSTERERKGLAVRRMYRTIAPWVTENPIMMHVRSADPAAVRLAIDQCADVGFEMVIMTFGSGFNIENEDPNYLKQISELVEYANAKGVELGGYSLLASRSAGPANDVIDPKTGKPNTGAIFGQSPCICSEWGRNYMRKLYAFFEKTGFNLLEHDGSYPGDCCASTTHPGHRGLNDSQWRQWKQITDFYKWCRTNGIYLNVPDFYFLAGSNKTGMGYRETNWSLPREQQIIHARQNIYDGTWNKTPSMGWMFVPLTEYHGGGAAATIEPLSEHLDVYEAHMANLFGSGVQACFRGPRLYDTDETRAVVKKWVDFYRKYRAILDSDVIHVRRADGRDLDCLLHVNPHLKEKGLAMVWNPLPQPIKKTLTVPLYYTGLTDTARIREQEGEPRAYQLDRQYNVRIEVEVPANGVTWFVIE